MRIPHPTASSILLLTMSTVMSIPCVQAKELFVSPLGDDGYEGSLARPLRTIQKAAELLAPGDVCTVRSGTYRETVQATASGSPENPIHFRNYPGEAVVISGTEPVSGWKQVSPGLYSAETSGKTDQLFVDGQMMNLARWPNAPLNPMQPTWAASEATSSAGNIYHSHLPEGQLTGAWVKVLPGKQWVSTTRPLVARRGGHLQFEANPFLRADFDYSIKDLTPFYLAGSVELLDSPGEWCGVPASHSILLRTPALDDPGKHLVEAKLRQVGFSLRQRNWVSLEGLQFVACAVDLTDASHCTVENCHLLYPSHFEECDAYKTTTRSGIQVSGHDNLIQGCSVQFCAGDGVSLQGAHNTLRDCLVRYVNYAAVECGAVSAHGQGLVIEHCSLSDSGRSVITHSGMKAGRIEYNDLARAGLLTRDCGLTYTWGADGQGTSIAYNWVHDNDAGDDLPTYGNGIYLDEGCSNYEVHHNVIWGVSHAGIQIGTPCKNLLFAFNTVVNRPFSLGVYVTHKARIEKTILVNNILMGPRQFAEGLTLSNNVETTKFYAFPGAWEEPETQKSQQILQLASPYLKESTAGKVRPPQIRPRSFWDFRPKPDSPGIDSAETLEEFPQIQSGHDIGAYESTAAPWVPGHHWGEPPATSTRKD